VNVSNSAAIRHLAFRLLKANKLRNIVAVVAVALTAVLFTAVFTLGGNMLAAIQDSTMRQVGTSAHAVLKYLTQGQYDNFANSPIVKDISYNAIVGIAENGALGKTQTEIRYSEEKQAKWEFSSPTAGGMPNRATDAAASTLTLDALGVPHELGASVPLEFTVNGKKHSENFTLCGYWQGDPAMGAQQVFLSKDYVQSVLPDFDGGIFAEVWFGSSIGIESKITSLVAERGYSAGEIQYGVNWAYAGGGGIDPSMAAISASAILLILLSGYLAIYSVFAISVAGDIHFYGFLKTIGMGGRQLRRVVSTQALLLSAIGVPIGLAFGYGVGCVLTPFLLEIAETGGVSFRANPLIFVFAAAFTLLTVFAGCRKPMKIAAKASPVEAVRYAEPQQIGKTKPKRTRAVNPYSMALANVLRNKRKLATVVLSLSLPLILLNSVFSAVKSFDMEKYLSDSINSDFAIADAGITPEIQAHLEAIGADISNIYYYAGTAQQVYGVGKPELGLFADTGYGKLRSGNYAIASKYAINMDAAVAIPQIGDIVTLANKDGITRDFEVIEVVDEYPYAISARYKFADCLEFAIADEVFGDFYGRAQPMQTNFNVAGDEIAETERWLENYTRNVNPELNYASRGKLMAEFGGLQKTYAAIGGALSFILALIGVLNFTNTVAASIFARRRELAILQSIGMAGGQTKSMLFCEGALYAVMAAVFTLTIGFGIGYAIMQAIAGQIWFFAQNFTLAPSLYCVLPLLLICAAVPLACCRRLSRESIVERLRVE
jgi:putative ABC transport system permease protein